MKLILKHESFRLAKPFTIARGSRTSAEVLTVEIHDDGSIGRGECVPYRRYGETLESVSEQIHSIALPVSREDLQNELPPGAARNAIDCALWDLSAKRANRPVWQLARLDPPRPVSTCYTVSLDSPERMHEEARTNSYRPTLKVKLGGSGDIERLRAVRRAAPDSQLVVDANESFAAKDFFKNMDTFVGLNVAMIEQPFPALDDEELAGFNSPVPICADESCHDRASLDGLNTKYAMINIKLDKTGGITEAIHLYEEAVRRGFQVMVGCMIGSSLAMAPALLIAQYASIVDLDGPLLLAEDRPCPIRYEQSTVYPPASTLWG